jgi:hypothetical protein
MFIEETVVVLGIYGYNWDYLGMSWEYAETRIGLFLGITGNTWEYPGNTPIWLGTPGNNREYMGLS